MITKGSWQELKDRKNFCLLRHQGRLQCKQFLETQLPKASPRDSSSNRRRQGGEEDIHSTQRTAATFPDAVGKDSFTRLTAFALQALRCC